MRNAIRLAFFAIFLLTACASVYLIAPQPFIVAEPPPLSSHLPLRVAIVRTPAMKVFPIDAPEKETLGKQLADSTFQGFLAAAQMIAVYARLTDTTNTPGFDVLCIPQNPFLEIKPLRERGPQVTITMEVLLRQVSTREERSLLLEAEGHPGRRPAVPLTIETAHGPMARVGVMGAPIHASHYEQALNNALFYLSLDFTEKLQKRLTQFIRENREQ